MREAPLLSAFHAVNAHAHVCCSPLHHAAFHFVNTPGIGRFRAVGDGGVVTENSTQSLQPDCLGADTWAFNRHPPGLVRDCGYFVGPLPPAPNSV